MTQIILLTAGVFIGRLWGKIADSQISDCPRCAIQNDERQMLTAMSAEVRQAEAHMHQTAEFERRQAETPRHRRTNDGQQADVFGGGR